MTDNILLLRISKNIETIADRLDALEKGQLELRVDVSRLQADADSLIGGQKGLEQGQTRLEKHARKTDKALSKITKDLNYIVEEFDEGIIKNTRRIERIEKHMGLPQSKD